MGYNDETPDLVRVFGETEESCRRAVDRVVARIDQEPDNRESEDGATALTAPAVQASTGCAALRRHRRSLRSLRFAQAERERGTRHEFHRPR